MKRLRKCIFNEENHKGTEDCFTIPKEPKLEKSSYRPKK